MAGSEQSDRLARAAEILATAEGIVRVGAGAGPDSPVGGRRGRASPRSAWAPPPDDPESDSPEADPESVARAIVLRQLSIAPRSRVQLEKKLRQRGCDDEAYAEMLVRSKQDGKGLARKALAHELRKQGIDGDIADDALAAVAPQDERARAEELVAKRLHTMSGLAPDVQARRLAGMLARKGYSGEIAWPVIRAAIAGLPEHQRD